MEYRSSTPVGSSSKQFCYMAGSKQAPTLRLKAGNKLQLNLINNMEPDTSGDQVTLPVKSVCGSNVHDSTSTNLHFHGMHVPPACHKDGVVFTLVNSGESFLFDIDIPSTHPPGLFWYHPHVFGLAEEALMGGASGALVVEGIESLYPPAAGLREVLLVIRDQPNGATDDEGTEPSWDLSVNYVPILYPQYTPGVLSIPEGELIFWRVLNAAADANVNLQLLFDNVTRVPQTLQMVARDGLVQDPNNPSFETTLPMPPAARMEFIARAPSARVASAQLYHLNEDTGPDGDLNPSRPLARISLIGPTTRWTANKLTVNAAAPNSIPSIMAKTPAAQRTLYFSEQPENENDPNSDTVFFITLDRNTPKAFDPLGKVDITAAKNTVEDWVIENHSFEEHVFHIHQLHFVVLEVNGIPLEPLKRVMQDTIRVGFWSGSGPYPSVKLRLDFSGKIGGTFVYHCHILEHEDKGMMAKIKVV